MGVIPYIAPKPEIGLVLVRREQEASNLAQTCFDLLMRRNLSTTTKDCLNITLYIIKDPVVRLYSISLINIRQYYLCPSFRIVYNFTLFYGMVCMSITMLRPCTNSATFRKSEFVISRYIDIRLCFPIGRAA